MKQPVNNKFLIAIILLFSSIFLFISLIGIIKYLITSIAIMPEEFLKFFKIFLNEENNQKNFMFEMFFIFKVFLLIISSGLIFVIYSSLSTVLNCIFYNFCSRNYKKIDHPLKFSIIKGLKWNLYRIGLILTPPFFVKTLSSFLLFSLLILFNFFLKIAGLSISLTAFIICFISFSLMFLFIISFLVSLWQLFSTLFGTVIAISEPRLKFDKIEKRSKKLILSKQFNIFLCIGYFLFILIIIFQIKYALTTNFSFDFENNQVFKSIIIFNLIYPLVFEYLKTRGYLNSLIEMEQKLLKCPVKAVKS